MALADVFPFGADGTPATIDIDGVTYRVLRVDSSGRLLISTAVPFTPTSVDSGQLAVTTPGTRVQFPTQAVRAVSIQARPANTGNVFLGDSGVTAANGRILAARDAVDVAIDNLNRLWLDAAVGGEGVSFLWVA